MAGQTAEGHGEQSQRGVMGTLRVTGSMELSEEGGNKKYRREEKAVSTSRATSKCQAVFWCCIIYQVLSFNQSLLSLSLSFFIALSFLNISLYMYLLICLLTVSPSRIQVP